MAGSYGGVAFMMQAVLFVPVMIGLIGWPSSVYLLQGLRGRPLSAAQLSLITLCFAGASALSIAIWIGSMRSGIRALEQMGE